MDKIKTSKEQPGHGQVEHIVAFNYFVTIRFSTMQDVLPCFIRTQTKRPDAQHRLLDDTQSCDEGVQENSSSPRPVVQ